MTSSFSLIIVILLIIHIFMIVFSAQGALKELSSSEITSQDINLNSTFLTSKINLNKIDTNTSITVNYTTLLDYNTGVTGLSGYVPIIEINIVDNNGNGISNNSALPYGYINLSSSAATLNEPYNTGTPTTANYYAGSAVIPPPNAGITIPKGDLYFQLNFKLALIPTSPGPIIINSTVPVTLYPNSNASFPTDVNSFKINLSNTTSTSTASKIFLVSMLFTLIIFAIFIARIISDSIDFKQIGTQYLWKQLIWISIPILYIVFLIINVLGIYWYYNKISGKTLTEFELSVATIYAIFGNIVGGLLVSLKIII